MKKSLIALTLAALPVAASADVVLYGNIRGGVDVTKERGVSGTTTQIADYVSFIGFKGHEDLNNGLRAIWQLEQRVDIGGGANTRGFGTRDSFIGLSGDNLGTVKVGYQRTPVMEVLDGKLNVWDYNRDAGTGTGIAPAGLFRMNRGTDAVGRYTAVTYETPNIGGFTAKAFVSPSNNNRTEPFTDANGEYSRRNVDAPVYGLKGSYAQENGFFADAAGVYVRHGRRNHNLGKANGYQGIVQGGYDNGTVLAGVAYQYSHDVDNYGDVTHGRQYLPDTRAASPATPTTPRTDDSARGQQVALTAAYKLNDSIRLKGSAAHGFQWKSSRKYSENDHKRYKALGNGKYYQGIVGADYLLSKRTTANAQIGYYQAGKGDDKVRAGTVSVGMKHRF